MQRWYLQAFFRLSSSRGHGFGSPQPITLQDMQAYLDMKDVTDVEARSRFVRYIQSMDQKYLNWQQEQRDD